MKVTEQMVAVFKRAWHEQDALDTQVLGARTTAGLQAVLDLIEPGFSGSDAVRRLADIPSDDPEGAHGKADAVLLDAVPANVRQAYRDLQGRCGGFWYA